MTFEEAKKKKASFEETITDENGLVFRVFIVPTDGEGKRKFYSLYSQRNRIMTDNDAIVCSTKQDFDVIGLRLHGSIVFDKRL